MIRRAQRDQRRNQRQKALEAPLPQPPPPVLHAIEDFYPDYPEDWIDVTEEAHHDSLLPTHITNVPSRTTYDLANTDEKTMQNAPGHIRQAALAVHSVGTELHEHTHTVHGIKDLLLHRIETCMFLYSKTGEWGNHRSGHISRGRTCICPELFQAKEGATFSKFQRRALCEIPPAQRPLHELA